MKYILFFATILLLGCIHTEKVSNTQQQKINKNNPTTQSSWVVSFISIGEGIDNKAFKSFEKLIAQYETKHSTKLKYEIINWGREGEKNFCFIPQQPNFFNEFSAETEKMFVKNVLVQIKKQNLCK